MITTSLGTLKINKLTQAQYDAALAKGNIKDDELYLTPDTEYSRYTTVVSSAGTSTISVGATVDNIGLASVYQNGLLLTQGAHYQFNDAHDAIALLDYTANEGDIFTFVCGLVVGDETESAGVRGSTVATQGASAITIPFTITSTAGLMVYENGLLLEEGEQYTASTTQITLNGYTADAGDVYTFVSGKSVTGASVTTRANKVILNSDSFDETDVQSALEYLKANLNSGDFLPLTGSSITGNFQVNASNTLSLTGSSASVTNVAKTSGLTVSSGGATVVKGASSIALSSSKVTIGQATPLEDENIRDIVISTSEPTSSNSYPIGTVWLVYEE